MFNYSLNCNNLYFGLQLLYLARTVHVMMSGAQLLVHAY
jgi:hypothetical protein